MMNMIYLSSKGIKAKVRLKLSKGYNILVILFKKITYILYVKKLSAQIFMSVGIEV